MTAYVNDLIARDMISIHTALAGCDNTGEPTMEPMDISIHTALAGCDCAAVSAITLTMIISIHTALAGCDMVMPTMMVTVR